MMKLLAAALLVLLVSVGANSQKPLVLTNVIIVDVTADKPIKALKAGQAVVITGNQITLIGQADKIRIPENADVIDAGGRYLIPGLWDMHVHSLIEGRLEYFLPILIANGITGVRDMGSNMSFERINQMRNDINSGKLVGPRYGAVAGSILDGPGTQLRVSIPVTDPNEARQTVRRFKEAGADFIKVYNLLSRDVYLAIIDEAKKQKLPVAGHVPFELSASEVSERGQKSIEHLNDIFVSASPEEKELRNQMKEKAANGVATPRFEFDIDAGVAYEPKRSKSLFERFVRYGTWQCPTLIVKRPSTIADPQSLNTGPRQKYIPASMRKNWEQTFSQRFPSATNVERRALAFQNALSAVGAMQAAGVEILAGSDTPNPYVFPGFGLHDELALLVQAGLTPLQALKTATYNPAKFLEMTDSIGTIEKGKLADLVLLDANPLDNIRNTQRIYAVVANGRYFSPSALRTLLVQAEAAAAKQ